MAKVFAVVRSESGAHLSLLSWRSKKAFSEHNSWLDERFIYVASTDDHKLNGLFSAYLEGDEILVVHTTEEIEAHNMMVDAMNGNTRASKG